MARYDVRLAAVALDVAYRWLDGVLARHRVEGVTSEVQGIRRTVSDDALVTLAIVRDLHAQAGLPIGRAIEIAERLEPDGRLRLGIVTVAVDRHAVARDLAPQVADAVERVVPRRRGRPPGQSGEAARGR